MSGRSDLMGWKDNVDLAFKLHSVLTRNLVADNSCVDERTSFAFSREILHRFDLMAFAVVSMQVNPEIIEQIERARQSYNEQVSGYTIAWTIDDVRDQSRRQEILAFFAKRNVASRQFDDAWRDAESKLQAVGGNFIYSALARFLSLYGQCESPLEKAFLIGVIAYDAYDQLWTQPETFACQLVVDDYRLDFAVTGAETKTKVATELDGHTYHERTEEQAVSDRNRDRALLQKGWKVIRFHRKEIEEDLAACVKQARETWRPGLLSKGGNS